MGDITIEHGDNPESVALIRQGLSQYNREQTGSREVISLVLTAKDENGVVVGGLTGESIWGWLLIETFWVSPEHRGKNYGHQLILEAEAIARQRGCQHITLETFSFQALPFYQKHGYVVYGQLDNFPAGQTRYSLKKDLIDSIPVVEKSATGGFQSALYQYDTQTAQEVNLQTDALYNVMIDLLQRRDLMDLLQKIVDYAAPILDAPYGEIMLLDGEELVVKAFTRNQPYLLGDRVKRGQALISWRAFDSHQPVLIDDYFNWSGKRVLYDSGHLQAVADFPIMLGDVCLGILAMGRTKPNHPFSQEVANTGMQFAQLIAVVVDNISLHLTIQAQNETLVKTNQDLAVAREKADAANRMKSQFLAGISHELRTPLNAIIGYSQLLAAGIAGEMNEEQTTFQERISANSQHLLELITDVLDLSKIEAGHMAVVKEVFSPRELVKEVELQNRVLADAKGLTLTMSVDDAMASQLTGDAGRLKQILINLLSNAIKFTDKGGVSIAIAPVDTASWRITVTDTGMGIPSHLQETVFDEFRQVDGEKQTLGTGLGLAITRKFVQLMGGTIALKSDLGQGSTFTITLPYVID